MWRSFRVVAMERLGLIMKSYEELIGLNEVKNAQQRVLLAEKSFSETQELRRSGQLQMQEILVKLKQIQLELDKTSRVEDRYLHLVTKEHSIIKEERTLFENLKQYEKDERERFASLTNAVRESHEKERSYAEKTKYWSVIGSVTGAIVGILGTAYNNRKRLNDLRGIVLDSTASSSATINEIQKLISQVTLDKKEQEQLLDAILDKLSKSTATTASSPQQVYVEDTASKYLIYGTFAISIIVAFKYFTS